MSARLPTPVGARIPTLRELPLLGCRHGWWATKDRLRMLKSETTPLELRAYAAFSIGVNVLGFLLMPLGHLVLRVTGIRKALVTPEMDAMLFIARSTAADGTACWYVSDMLAFPPGRGAGRRLLEVLCEQADRGGIWLTLNANNPDLATKFYAPLGFVVVPGDEHEFRPKMTRPPRELRASPSKVNETSRMRLGE